MTNQAHDGERMTVFLAHSLKPEEISGPEQKHRIAELLGWFKRYFEGNANPKWLAPHAAELAYALQSSLASAAHDGERVVTDNSGEWVMVPRRMTAAMINAWSGGETVTSDEIAYRTHFQEAWTAVLSAAAPPPAGEPK